MGNQNSAETSQEQVKQANDVPKVKTEETKEKKPCKPCCACPETRQIRDAWYVKVYITCSFNTDVIERRYI